MTAHLETSGSSNHDPAKVSDPLVDQGLVDRLLVVEEQIRQAPARSGTGPFDVNPDLVRLALEEAELLERLGRSRTVTP